MRRSVVLTSLALAALLVGCGEPETVTVTTKVVEPASGDPEQVPPLDDDAVASEPDDIWAEHRGDIPWIIGAEAGIARAQEENKPILFFYTATW